MATNKTVTVAKKNTSSTTKALALTDPRRKLTREEWATMPKEQKAERKAARLALRGPAKQRFAKLVLRYATRFERMQKAFANDKPIADTMHSLVTNARSVASEIDELPETWTPAGRKPRVSFALGQRVQLVEAQLAHYADLLPGEKLDALEVVHIAGRHVACKTGKGTRIVLDAKHVHAKA